MRRKILERLFAHVMVGVILTTSAFTSLAAENDGTETSSDYVELKDENGNVYDLGGMEIIIRDWRSLLIPALIMR